MLEEEKSKGEKIFTILVILIVVIGLAFLVMTSLNQKIDKIEYCKDRGYDLGYTPLDRGDFKCCKKVLRTDDIGYDKVCSGILYWEILED